jgi:hypothetical protein
MSKLTKDIKSFNDKGQRHGYWELYYYYGSLWYKRFYHNGKKVGYEEYYSYLGELIDKIYNL